MCFYVYWKTYKAQISWSQLLVLNVAFWSVISYVSRVLLLTFNNETAMLWISLAFFWILVVQCCSSYRVISNNLAHKLGIVLIFETVQTCLMHGATLDTDKLLKNSDLVASHLETLWWMYTWVHWWHFVTKKYNYVVGGIEWLQKQSQNCWK